MPPAKPRSHKSYVMLDSRRDRNPTSRAILVTSDADFGAVEVIEELPLAIIVAYRESGRGKPKWVNASVMRSSIKSFRRLHLQAGESVAKPADPTWLSSPLCRLSHTRRAA